MSKLEDLWKFHAYSKTPSSLSLLLQPLSLLYRVLSRLKRGIYDSFPFLKTNVPNPVFVVGNISVGGTGKTPMTLTLLEYLNQFGKHTVLISRGYGSRFQGSFAHYENGSWDREGFFGDELQLCLKRFPNIEAGVGKRRAVLVQRAAKRRPDSVILLDDALQYWRLGHATRICMIHGSLGFGNGSIFPNGPLREKPVELKRVQAVVISYPTETLDSYRRKLELYDYKGPVYLLHSGIDEFTSTRQSKFDRAKPAILITGIAHPQLLRIQLESEGLYIDELISLGDHGEFSSTILEGMREANRKGRQVLITAKDHARLPENAADCFVVHQKLRIEPEAQFKVWFEQQLQIQ